MWGEKKTSRAPAGLSGNQRKSSGVKAEILHNAKGRIYRNLQRPQSGRSTTCRAAPPNSNCKIACAPGSGGAMRWEYPICPEMQFSTLVVVRPYVSSSGPNAADPQHAAQRRQTQTARLLARLAVEKRCAGSIPFVQKCNFQPLSWSGLM